MQALVKEAIAQGWGRRGSGRSDRAVQNAARSGALMTERHALARRLLDR
jgi:hypothetical protein